MTIKMENAMEKVMENAMEKVIKMENAMEKVIEEIMEESYKLIAPKTLILFGLMGTRWPPTLRRPSWTRLSTYLPQAPPRNF